jgi:hypothetical protein
MGIESITTNIYIPKAIKKEPKQIGSFVSRA